MNFKNLLIPEIPNRRIMYLINGHVGNDISKDNKDILPHIVFMLLFSYISITVLVLLMIYYSSLAFMPLLLILVHYNIVVRTVCAMMFCEVNKTWTLPHSEKTKDSMKRNGIIYAHVGSDYCLYNKNDYIKTKLAS